MLVIFIHNIWWWENLFESAAFKYPTKLLKAFTLSENMQQAEGSQPEQSCESPSNMQPVAGNLSPGYTNPSNIDGSYPGCVSNPNGGEYVSCSEASHSQQPETLNLPAVLWDKPVGSKIRVPPPVPPRSPRKPIDPVTSGAFEAVMDTHYPDDSSEDNVAPLRGLPLGITLHAIELLLILY